MELNRERIIRGLACCKGSYDCFTCDIYKRGCAGFREGLARDALSLIKEQEQRIFDLEKRLRYLLQSKTIQEYDVVDTHTKEYVKDIHSLDANIEHLTEENERLNKEVDRLSQVVLYNDGVTEMKVEEAKVDTLSELKICLTREVGTYLSISTMKVSDMFKLIDQIAKEMLEGV